MEVEMERAGWSTYLHCAVVIIIDLAFPATSFAAALLDWETSMARFIPFPVLPLHCRPPEKA